ncbi:MAG: sulfatase-like hydrolase/transferase, partial [Bacteroidota bacterium]
NPYRFGITFAMKGKLEESEIPITTVLKDNGYTTGHFGKWHMGTLSKKPGDQKRWGAFAENPVKYYTPPWERDVDVSFVTESKVPTWDPMIDPEAKEEGKSYGNEYFTGEGQVVTENLEGDDSRVIMDRVIPFIQNANKKNKPFIAVVWFHTPHAPVIAGPEYKEMYKNFSESKQNYYGCITAMDEQIGRLRTVLRDMGIENNTMLWFCSDNGPAMQAESTKEGSTGGLRGAKLSIYEGGIRVPGLLVWPEKIPKPFKVDIPGVTSDYFPTILDALEIPLPSERPYDGISLLPVIEQKQTERNVPIGFLNRNGREAVWMGNTYKLIHDEKEKRFELYNIVEDAEEQENLVKSHPHIASQMKKELFNWKAEVMNDLAKIESNSD